MKRILGSQRLSSPTADFNSICYQESLGGGGRELAGGQPHVSTMWTECSERAKVASHTLLVSHYQEMGTKCCSPVTACYNAFPGFYEESHEAPSSHTQGEIRAPSGNRPSLSPPPHHTWLGHVDSREGPNTIIPEPKGWCPTAFLPAPTSQGRPTRTNEYPKFSTVFCLHLSSTGSQQ